MIQYVQNISEYSTYFKQISTSSDVELESLEQRSSAAQLDPPVARGCHSSLWVPQLGCSSGWNLRLWICSEKIWENLFPPRFPQICLKCFIHFLGAMSRKLPIMRNASWCKFSILLIQRTRIVRSSKRRSLSLGSDPSRSTSAYSGGLLAQGISQYLSSHQVRPRNSLAKVCQSHLGVSCITKKSTHQPKDPKGLSAQSLKKGRLVSSVSILLPLIIGYLFLNWFANLPMSIESSPLDREHETR